MITIKCCRNCKERHPMCHSDCLKYIKEKKALEEEKERIKKIKEFERGLDVKPRLKMRNSGKK